MMITIYTAVYNGDSFLKETIESILQQSYTDWEYFLLDDGSTDDSAAICLQYAQQDTRITYIHYKHTGNPALIRNKALELGKGDWFANCDQDDLWHPDRLQLQMQGIADIPPSIFFTVHELFITSKDLVYKPVTFSTPEQFESTTLLAYNPIMHSATLVHKDVYTKIGLLDERISLKGLDDYDFWLRAVCAQIPFYILSLPLAYLRKHENNLSLLITKELLQVKLALQEAAAHCHSFAHAKSFIYYYNRAFVNYQLAQLNSKHMSLWYRTIIFKVFIILHKLKKK